MSYDPLCSQSPVSRMLRFLAETEAVAPTRSLAAQAGYHLEHTGGGCVVWERDLGDGTVLWVFTEGANVAAHPDEVAWMVRRQSQSEIGGLIEIDDCLSFQSALDIAVKIPSPVASHGEVNTVFDTLADFIAYTC